MTSEQPRRLHRAAIVVDAAGAALPGWSVDLSSVGLLPAGWEELDLNAGVIADTAGAFKLNVIPGVYNVTIRP